METNQQIDETSDEAESLTCIKCNVEGDENNLFCPEMSVMAQIKGKEDGPENAFITLDDLYDFTVCEKCQKPGDEYYTLASSIASCRGYQERRNNRNNSQNNNNTQRSNRNSVGFKGRDQKADQPHRAQAAAPQAKVEAHVNCYVCGSSVPRHQAKAPGWVGCNILQARRLQDADRPGVEITAENVRKIGYVSSADLLRTGRDGFVPCANCMDKVIKELHQEARAIGLPEDEIKNCIQPWLLIHMIRSVQKKERAQNRRRN